MKTPVLLSLYLFSESVPHSKDLLTEGKFLRESMIWPSEVCAKKNRKCKHFPQMDRG